VSSRPAVSVSDHGTRRCLRTEEMVAGGWPLWCRDGTVLYEVIPRCTIRTVFTAHRYAGAMARQSVCLSVRLSQAGTASNSCTYHNTINANGTVDVFV